MSSGDSEPRKGVPGLRWMGEGHPWIGLGVFALIAVLCFGTASSEAVTGLEVVLVAGGSAAALAFFLIVARLFAGSGRHQQVKATQDGDQYQRALDAVRQAHERPRPDL